MSNSNHISANYISTVVADGLGITLTFKSKSNNPIRPYPFGSITINRRVVGSIDSYELRSNEYFTEGGTSSRRLYIGLHSSCVNLLDVLSLERVIYELSKTP